MDPSTVVTIGLVATIVVCVAGGIGVVVWLYSKFGEGSSEISAAKAELLKAIADSRKEGDRGLEILAAKLDAVTTRQVEHELDVERRFVTKDSAGNSYDRIETAIAEVKGDMRNLTATLTSTLRNLLRGRVETET
jgi:hypothetical protein